MMGAGNACSAVYHTNTNLNTFGGSKKQGITSRVGLDNWANTAIQTYSNGYGRNKLFTLNQLGGVGVGKSMFNGRFTQVDGTRSDELPNKINRLKSLLALYPPYINPSDPYHLALFGDKESFKQDLIYAGVLPTQHTKTIHFDTAYVFPMDVPNRNEIIRLVLYINAFAKAQIPNITNGIDFGTHTLSLVATKTGRMLYDAGYGHTTWYKLQVFSSKLECPLGDTACEVSNPPTSPSD
jgi:hypothetical protein